MKNAYGLPDVITFTNGMTDHELIGYCELHCTTERALFNGAQINRMIELAGFPDGFVREVLPSDWISVHEEMAELARLARTKMKGTP